MQTVTCINEECLATITFNLSDLEIEDSQPSGNHTTQHSGSGMVECTACGTENELNCIWDVLNDTGEILSKDFT